MAGIYLILDGHPADADYRRRVALRGLHLLQERISAAGDRYSGSFVPNFTSITGLLSVPIEEVRQAVAEYPALDPEADAVVG